MKDFYFVKSAFGYFVGCDHENFLKLLRHVMDTYPDDYYVEYIVFPGGYRFYWLMKK